MGMATVPLIQSPEKRITVPRPSLVGRRYQFSPSGAAIARAPPDGYLIGIATSGVLAFNPHIYHNLGFAPQRDLAPITLMAMTPVVLVASPTAPVKSVAEIFAFAKSSPDKLSIGHPGTPAFNLAHF
jgi:tripartite-type tricarboxylate transporter receptor subunit TctC